MKIRELKNDLGRTCRSCLNDIYDLKLEQQDCQYGEYPHKCRRCGEVNNIVENISLNKKVSLIFKKAEIKEDKVSPRFLVN